MINSACESSRHNGRFRLALLTATALTLAACSGSADRLADFSDFSTSSLPAEQETGVAAAPLPEASSPTSQRPAWQNGSSNASTGGTASSYTQGASGTVTVQSGQTLYSIARANDMSPDELARANDIAPPYAIRVGQRLTVPGRADPATPGPRSEPQSIQAANAPTSRPQFGEGGTHVVRPGETLFAVGRAYSMDPFTIAEYNQLSQPYALNVGQTLRIPSSGSQVARQDAAPVTSGQPMTLDQQMAARQQDAGQSQLQLQFQTPSQTQPQSPAWTNGQSNGVEADSQTVVPGSTLPPSDQSASVGTEPASSTFRWPVKGRVISTYGEKPNGMRNEGINIAVPEGTSVRAAGSGIVAYAGSELKGYGNLVLIRHDGGWVTAYAHNKELFVKRGDSVKRGDVIANAGQTGSVTSPQVHFEVRKGATAVDPMKHLDTEQAMN